MNDYKMEIQELAEQAAEDKYGKGFYELDQYSQDAIYLKAMQDWHDKQADRAELMRDAARDEGNK